MNTSSPTARKLPRSARRKWGYTLLEALVAMTVGSGLTILGIRLVIASLGVSDLHAAQVGQTMKMNQFSDMFRRDVRTSFQASIQADRQGVRLERANGERIVYQVEDGRLSRFATSLRNDGQESTIHREDLELVARVRGWQSEVRFVRAEQQLQLQFRRSHATHQADIAEQTSTATLGSWLPDSAYNQLPASTAAEEGEDG